MKKIGMFFLVLFFVSLLFADLHNGLVLDLRCNGNANDESGNGNDAIVHNAQLTSDRFGNPDSAYEFGFFHYLYVPYNNSLDIRNGITMSAWIYLSSTTSGWQPLFYKDESSRTPSPYAMFIKNHKITYLHNEDDYYSSLIVPSQEWVHVAVVWDGTFIKYYLNGQKDTHQDYEPTILTVSNGNLFIGYNPTGTGTYYNGYMDDIRLYNRALTDQEIDDLYNFANNNIPQNVQITLNEHNLVISWNHVPDAVSYNLYYSNDPNRPLENWYILQTGITDTVFTASYYFNKTFFRVTSIK